MEYTVLALCRLAGITPRTLRYYDEIGLLSPKRKEFTGYRIYGQVEVDRLQQILFYRELGIPLHAVREILDAPAYNALEELRKHREKMINEQKRLDALVGTISRTIASMEGDDGYGKI
jgi:DNA-binding transcriptional MerR regulator